MPAVRVLRAVAMRIVVCVMVGFTLERRLHSKGQVRSSLAIGNAKMSMSTTSVKVAVGLRCSLAPCNGCLDRQRSKKVLTSAKDYIMTCATNGCTSMRKNV